MQVQSNPQGIQRGIAGQPPDPDRPELDPVLRPLAPSSPLSAFPLSNSPLVGEHLYCFRSLGSRDVLVTPRLPLEIPNFLDMLSQPLISETMIDTIRLGIPLTLKQFTQIQNSAFASDQPLWAKLYPDTGELWIRRVTGLAQTDQNSFHREIRWDVPFNYQPNETFLTVELSLPKLYYGHNIRLLYKFVSALDVLKALFEKHFSFKRRDKLPDLLTWEIWRLDCCYAWQCPSEQVAYQLLDSLKHLNFPRKRPITYPTSIVFAGTTYSLKFYLKLPEFKAHDQKVLLKANASLEWINHCESMADGVLRVEATLRRKYLKRAGIKQISDLFIPVVEYIFDEPESYPDDFDFSSAFFAIMVYNTDTANENNQSNTEWNTGDGIEVYTDWNEIVWNAADGQRFNAPEGLELVMQTPQGEVNYRHTGEGFILSKKERCESILQSLLIKFLGASPTMQHSDEVEAKLSATFKPVKAARLMAMWLYFQKYGGKKTKEAFGHDSYYASRRDMKKAGVSLVERPENVVELHKSFWQKFQLTVPSEYVVNKVDDFRDGGNVLNLPVVKREAES